MVLKLHVWKPLVVKFLIETLVLLPIQVEKHLFKKTKTNTGYKKLQQPPF